MASEAIPIFPSCAVDSTPAKDVLGASPAIESQVRTPNVLLSQFSRIAGAVIDITAGVVDKTGRPRTPWDEPRYDYTAAPKGINSPGNGAGYGGKRRYWVPPEEIRRMREVRAGYRTPSGIYQDKE